MTTRTTTIALTLALGVLLSWADTSHAALPSWCDVTLSPTIGDQTAAIQNALDTGSGTATNLHWVCLQNGQFNVSGELRFNKDYTALRGDTSTTINLTSSDTNKDGLNIANRTKVKVQYLTINANRKKRRFTVLAFRSSDVEITSVNLFNLDNVHGIGINDSTNVRVNGGTIQHLGGAQMNVHDAIWTFESSEVKVRWVTMLGAGDGPGGDGAITCYDTQDYLVEGVQSWSPGSSGIYLVNCSDFLVINNTVNGSSEWGLDIVGGTNDGALQQNVIQSSRFGAMIISNAACDFYGCTTRDIAITGNSMTSNNTAGVASCASINVGVSTSNISIVGNSTNQPPVWCWR